MSPDIELDVEHYNLLLEGVAGLANRGEARLIDGERLMIMCVKDGLRPDEVSCMLLFALSMCGLAGSSIFLSVSRSGWELIRLFVAFVA